MWCCADGNRRSSPSKTARVTRPLDVSVLSCLYHSVIEISKLTNAENVSSLANPKVQYSIKLFFFSLQRSSFTFNKTRHDINQISPCLFATFCGIYDKSTPSSIPTVICYSFTRFAASEIHLAILKHEKNEKHSFVKNRKKISLRRDSTLLCIVSFLCCFDFSCFLTITAIKLSNAPTEGTPTDAGLSSPSWLS